MNHIKHAYELGATQAIRKVAEPTPVDAAPPADQLIREAYGGEQDNSVFLQPPVEAPEDPMSSNVSSIAENLLAGPVGVDVANKRILFRGKF